MRGVWGVPLANKSLPRSESYFFDVVESVSQYEASGRLTANLRGLNRDLPAVTTLPCENTAPQFWKSAQKQNAHVLERPMSLRAFGGISKLALHSEFTKKIH